MSTRAFIGIKVAKDAIVGVYNHSDGYPSYLGELLLENYKDLAVWQLIAIGDMYICGKTISECDPFSTVENPCDLMPRFHHNLDEIYEYQSDFEYAYMYDPEERVWYFNKKSSHDGWKLLTKEECEKD